MDRREREMLDRHITGNYGEDFPGGIFPGGFCCECGGDENTCTCDPDCPPVTRNEGDA